MGFLFSSHKKTVNTQPKISNISYTTCTYGSVINLIYGTSKVSGNVIDYYNFTATPVQTSSGGGGKGGGGGGTVTINWDYHAYVLLGVAQGLIQGIGNMWLNSTLTTLAHEGVTLYAGSNVQLPWPSMPASRAMAYRNLAYLAGNMNLGDTASIPNYTIEVHGLLSMDTSLTLQSTEYYQANSESGNLTTVYYTPEFSNYISTTVNMQVSFVNNVGTATNISNFTTYTLQAMPATATTYPYQRYAINLTSLGTNNAIITVTYNYTTNLDANPVDIVKDFLVNNVYGCAFPASYLGDWTDFRNYCIAAGIFFSPAYTSQDQASTMVETLVNTANGEFVFSQGLLKLVSLGDQQITGNNTTWTPNLTPIYNLTEDDFLNQTEPITCTRSIQSDVYNNVTLEYYNRSNSYNVEIAQAQDLANIQTFGFRPADVITADFICSTAVAKRAVHMLLDRNVSFRNVYAFKLPITFILLDPLDVVSITVPSLGLNNKLVRILTINEADDESLEFTAQEINVGSGSPATYHIQATTREVKTSNADPGYVNPIVAFELPFAMTNNQLVISIGASGQNSNWGGCNIWASTDGLTYGKVGTIKQPCRQGILTSILPATQTDPDTSNTLSIDVSMSDATLLSGTQSDADNYITLCYVDGELISYQNATLTGTNTYDLTYLRRGIYGTGMTMHPPGSQFCRIDNNLINIPFQQDQIGTYLYIKVTSFNVFGIGEQNLTDVHPYIYTIRGTALTELPANVTNLIYYYQNGNYYLQWDTINDIRGVIYEVRVGDTWDNALVLGQYAQSSVIINGTGYYLVKAYIANASIYSDLATGLQVNISRIPENVIQSYDESATSWSGTLTNAYVTTDGYIHGQLPTINMQPIVYDCGNS